MRSAKLFGRADIRICSEPLPQPLDDEVLVTVTAVGLCGSDLHWFTDGGIGDAVVTEPLVLGHECAGVIASGPEAGTRVAIDPAIGCQQCEFCVEGNQNFCLAMRFAGHGLTHGGLREHMCWPRRRLHPVPDEISDVGAAVLEPLGVALHSVDLAHVRMASTAAVIGCGPIGLLTIQLLRAAGVDQIIAVEPLAHRRQAATDCGADVVVDPLAAKDIDGGAQVVFEVSGDDDGLASGLHLARHGAKVMLVGIPDVDRTAFPASQVRRKGLSLIAVRRMKEMYPRAIRLVQRGLVDVDAIVTASFALADTARAMEVACRREGLKVMVRPNG